MASLFFSYTHRDEDLRDELEVQLAALKRQGVITTWHDRRIDAGDEFAAAIDTHIESDDIILLLVSADFIASDYCYNIEMKRAMERHEAGDAIVIPVILRACDWHGTPFGKLNATPPDGKPVTQFADRDQAMLEVAKAVRKAAERLKPAAATDSTPVAASWKQPRPVDSAPRSSNLALVKSFTDRDRDTFKRATFEYLVRYFSNSAIELAARNAGIDADVARIDANRFTASIYKNGAAVAQCTVFLGDRHFGSGIAYSSGERSTGFSYNEMLIVEAGDQSLYLTSMGMQMMGRQRDQKLTQEGAAELYWGMLIQPLQVR